MAARLGWNTDTVPNGMNFFAADDTDETHYEDTYSGNLPDIITGVFSLQAGVNRDGGGGAVVWTPTWLPVAADPTPNITYFGASNQFFKTSGSSSGGPPINLLDGELQMRATLAGVPVPGYLRLVVTSDPDYGSAQWQWVGDVPIDADFSGTPLSGPAPLSTQFTDESTPASSPAPYAYKWDYGDGTALVIDTDPAPLHGYAAEGVYDVKLRAYWEDNGSLIGPIQFADSFAVGGALVGASPAGTNFLIPSVWRDTGDGNLLLKTGGKLTTTASDDSSYARASIGVNTGGAPVDPLPYYMTGETLKATVDITFTGAPGSPQGLALLSMQHDTFDGLERAVITGQITNLSGIGANMRMNLSTNLGGNTSFDFTGLGAGTYPLVLEFYKNKQKLSFQGHQVVLTDDFSVLPRTDINLVTVQLRRFVSMANLSLMAMDDEEAKTAYVTVTGAPPAPPPSIGTAMNVLPVSRLIHVGVNLTPAGAQGQDLSTLLVMGTSSVIDTTERMRIYTRLEDIAADFGTGAEEYKAAVLWFEQVPQPSQLNIGRWVNASSRGGIRGATLNAASQLMSAWTGIANGSFTVTKDAGGPQNVTGLNFTGAANLNAVAAIIQAGFTGTTVVWNATYQRFEITSNTTGATSAISFLSVQGAGTDISALLGMRSTSSGAYLFGGQIAESAVAAVQAMNLAFNQLWYACVVPSAIDSDHLAIAAFLEGTNTKHFYGVTTQEAGVLVAADTSNIAYALKQLAYKKTMVQYSSSNPYAVVSALARILTTNYQGNSTVITLMYKQEPGIVAESINSLQADALESFNCNVFVNYDNNTAILEKGVTSSGIFADIVLGTDWLAVDLIKNLYNLLYTSLTKIPQTDAGTHLLVTTCEAVLTQAVINGLLAPGVWNSGGFGELRQGDYLQTGFYVYAPSVNTQDPADRAARKSVPIQIAAKLAGAVHEVFVSVLVNQ